jgi:hypothetical protein
MPASNIHAQLSFQVCPIVLTGGIAGQVPGGVLPMLSLFYASGSALQLPYDINDLDDAFGAFNVLPGGTLIAQTIGKYPFANQYVAANAVIREPLTLSIIMDAPMRGQDAWRTKLMVMTALKAALDTHNNNGGTYTVMTPACVYQNLIMTALTDNSRGNNSLPQNAWRFDFEKPLVTLADVNGAQNQFMQKLTNGVPTAATQTGPQPGTPTGQAQLTDPPKVGAALSAGNPPILFNSPTVFTSPTGSVYNYPASITPAGSPFTGIS